MDRGNRRGSSRRAARTRGRRGPGLGYIELGRSCDNWQGRSHIYAGDSDGTDRPNTLRGNNYRSRRPYDQRRHSGRGSDSASWNRRPYDQQGHSGRGSDSASRNRRPYDQRGYSGRGSQHHTTSESTGERRHDTKHWQRYDIIELACESSENIFNRVQNEEEAFLNAFNYSRFLGDDFMLRNLIKLLYLIIQSRNDVSVRFACRLTSQVVTNCNDFLSKFRELIQLRVKNLSDPLLNHVLKIAFFCVNQLSSTMVIFPHADLQSTIKRLLDQSCIADAMDVTIYRIRQEYEQYCEEYEIKLEEMVKAQTCKQTHVRQQIDTWWYGQIDPADALHNAPPPDDFHDRDILPMPDEINNSEHEPFLRTNLIKKDYCDAGHYLDVQFRLLQEDFVGPLRDGIESLREPQPDVAIYKRVRILEPVCLFSGIGFRIQFNPAASRLERVQWEHSSKLIYGSLLCLSKDNFQNILFASVVDRNPTELTSGLLTVRFEGENSHRSAFDTSPKQEYTMIESSAYYEAYRHVLECLQQIIPDQLPFQPYIVKHYPGEIPPPLYLHKDSLFDFSNVLEFKNNGIGICHTMKIDVKDCYNWPKASQTNLDTSQLDALKMSLSQEISVIQGPPGTGKTFIGLKIVDALLQNCNIWNPNRESPILVICYTNHALDQFLEGILEIRVDGTNGYQHPPNVVRIGGRCKSERLKPYVLANMVKIFREKRRLSKGLAGHYKKVRVNMEKIQEDFENKIGNLDFMEGKLLSFEELDNVHLINRNHSRQLVQKAGLNACIEVWLELIKNPAQLIEFENDADLVPENDEDDEECIDVIDEPQLLEEDRQEEGDEEFEFVIESLKRSKERKEKRKVKPQKSNLIQENGWQVVEASEKKRKKRIADGIKEIPMTDDEVIAVRDVWTLPLKQRWRLYLNWLNEFLMLSKTDLSEIAEEYNASAKECMEVKEDINLSTISEAHVVGMTTTGAAKHNYLLKKLHPKIVIVEEAAEVMEPHIITSLCSSVQQLILIGDHKQLQPKPAYFKLEKEYDFNISLFERLIKKNILCVTLTTQHRMRPEIARIVGNHIYDRLDDAESVKRYENVKGVEKNLFFIEHKEKEDSTNDDSRSRSNTYEARYVTSLTQYLLNQGYRKHQITILTMYRGQLIKIKKQMSKRIFAGVRVAAVDDFQGEENDIIILSLVRSNPGKRIGFLKIENRVCVALSRAKKGMFVIGDFSMLRSKNDTKWPVILEEMEAKKFLGEGLPLCCQNHPQEKILAKAPEDFSKSIAGGCQRQCDTRLQCGHVCQKPCHPDDMKHEKLYKCTKKCGSTLTCGHRCDRSCYQCRSSKDCGPCKIQVNKQLPLCGHYAKIQCSTDPSKHKCMQSCDKRINDCGHKCTNKCSDECITSDKCTEKCPGKLNCSHKCQGTCGECYKGRLHVRCKEKCNRILPCGHACKFPCTPNCPPCDEKCTNYCFHGKCPKKCYEPCVSCREPCKWKCKHDKCGTACGEMCNRLPCNKPCRKIIKCGHPCIGLCGEDCPTLCRICDKDVVTEVFFGTEDEEDARFIQLKDCKHVFEMSGLDQWMKQNIDGAGEFKECPKCKTPIRRTLRYGNIVKSALIKMEEIKKGNLKSHINKDALLQDIIILDRECKIAEPLLHNLVRSVQDTLEVCKPHQLLTIHNQVVIIPKLLKTLRLVTTCQLHNSDTLLLETHRIIKFMNEPFLTSQQVTDIEAETIKVYSLALIYHFKAIAAYEGKTLEQNDEGELNSLAKLLKEMDWKISRPNLRMQDHVESRIEAFKQKYRCWR